VAVRVVRDGREETLSLVIDRMKDGEDEESAAGETGRLGLAVRQLTKELAASLRLKETAGVVITEVKPESPAMQAGLQRGDIVREVNGRKVATVDDYDKALAAVRKDKTVRLLIRHGDGSRFVVIKMD
jgi:serine protease Do